MVVKEHGTELVHPEVPSPSPDTLMPNKSRTVRKREHERGKHDKGDGEEKAREGEGEVGTALHKVVERASARQRFE